MQIPDKLKSRKFWTAFFSGGALIISALFDFTVDPALIEALTLIAVTALGGIAFEDTVKAYKND